jgi:hypothetical protein
MQMKQFFLGLCTITCLQPALHAYYAFNIVYPHDRYLWTGPQPKGTFQINVFGVGTFHEKGAQWNHTNVCDVLQLFESSQSTLAMVKGFDPQSIVGQVAAALNNVPDDGVRGHVVPTAHWSMKEAGFGAQYWLPHWFYIGVYVPLFHMKLCNISWHDCTKDITAQDALVKELVTNNLAENVRAWSGLEIQRSWSHRGFGDVSLIAGWERNFAQQKPILTDVLLSLYAGVSLPTGKRANENELFSIPLGYDGSTGILFGGTLGLVWKNHFTGGIETHFTQLMGNTRVRRLRTDWEQTNLLLLAKTTINVDWGFIQRYRLYLGAVNLVKGFSCNLAYQFQKQGNSLLSICNNDYITSIANGACQYKEWTLHQIQFDANYNFGFNMSEEERFKPTLGFFYQHDFKGRRALRANRIGAFASLSF